MPSFPRLMFFSLELDFAKTSFHQSQGNNVELLKWWSQYLESRGEFEKARKTYARARDYLSLVRLACQSGQVERVRGDFPFAWTGVFTHGIPPLFMTELIVDRMLTILAIFSRYTIV